MKLEGTGHGRPMACYWLTWETQTGDNWASSSCSSTSLVPAWMTQMMTRQTWTLMGMRARWPYWCLMAGEVGRMNTYWDCWWQHATNTGHEIGIWDCNTVGEGLHLEKYLDVIRYHYFVQRIMLVFMGREGRGLESNWQSWEKSCVSSRNSSQSVGQTAGRYKR